MFYIADFLIIVYFMMLVWKPHRALWERRDKNSLKIQSLPEMQSTQFLHGEDFLLSLRAQFWNSLTSSRVLVSPPSWAALLKQQEGIFFYYFGSCNPASVRELWWMGVCGIMPPPSWMYTSSFPISYLHPTVYAGQNLTKF